MSFNLNPLYSSQWHFNLIGDIEVVWADYTGAGVTVAVYDDGIQTTHPDLDDNYDAAQNLDAPYDDVDPYPGISDAGHGTAVAGLIAAENNSEGGIGVAWGASLVSVNFFEDLGSANLSLDEVQAMANFDVVNASFGIDLFSSDSDISGASAFVQDLAADIVANGRGGLGTIMVKAAGNSGGTYDPSSQNDPDSVVRESIVVAASDRFGNITDYSSWGVNVLVTAPAAAYTTDLLGSDGYNGISGNNAYTDNFGGTSAATPVTAGVVALILEANPQLGWRDVQQILAMSAAHTGSDFGSGASGHEVGAWFSNGANNWNGGGLTYHINYGFGMVDALAAVRLAEVWSILHSVPLTSANETSDSFSSALEEEVVINDTRTVSDTIPVTTNEISIEHIYVEVNATHNYSGDLEIVLVAPDGTEFVLHSKNGDFGYYAGYTYSVAGALGMSSLGAWTLRIDDAFEFDDGVLTDWRIEFFGSAPSVDDVHSFTDDFFDLAFNSPEADRQIISDDNGGTDWMNLVAVTEDVSIVQGLGPAASGRYGSWRNADTFEITDIDVFENFAFGDGDDTLTLTGATHNHILAGRGDDSVDAGDGNDSIEGGAGDDTLTGGLGDDTVTGDAGSNRFVYVGGNDTITDFGPADQLQIDEAWGIEDFNALMALASDADGGASTLFTFAAGATLLLSGIQQNFLTDFQVAFPPAPGGGTSRDDILSGTRGADYIVGAAGNDRIDGGKGNDTLEGGTGNDTLIGKGGSDDLSGGDDNDIINAGGGNDTVLGGAGDDNIIAGGGRDSIDGGENNDTINAGGGSDTVLGGAGDDNIIAGGGRDSIDGGENNDTINAGGGKDTISGGEGDDVLTGGGGRDLFIFDFGNDVITDFNKKERVDISTFGAVSDLADLLLLASASGVNDQDTTIDFGGGNSLTLLDTNMADLRADDFIFSIL